MFSSSLTNKTFVELDYKQHAIYLIRIKELHIHREYMGLLFHFLYFSVLCFFFLCFCSVSCAHYIVHCWFRFFFSNIYFLLTQIIFQYRLDKPKYNRYRHTFCGCERIFDSQNLHERNKTNHNFTRYISKWYPQ